jgi:hypothetical protein
MTFWPRQNETARPLGFLSAAMCSSIRTRSLDDLGGIDIAGDVMIGLSKRDQHSFQLQRSGQRAVGHQRYIRTAKSGELRESQQLSRGSGGAAVATRFLASL